MEPELDIRWKQRFDHFQKALQEFTEAVNLAHQRSLSKLETQGLIQAFEFTHELSWNVMKDFIAAHGDMTIIGSRDATREAFQKGLISEGQIWMDMIKSRNLTSHTYNEDVALDIADRIIHQYSARFKDFEKKMLEFKK